MPSPAQDAPASPALRALRTARWARIMTKWLITHSSRGGVKWQVVSFNGPKGQESAGIVDMIAIRKNHAAPQLGSRGDLFEIILVQVKGGSAKFPTDDDVKRLMSVKAHHRASKVVLVEWKQAKKLACYVLPNLTVAVPAAEVFGAGPSAAAVVAQARSASAAA